MVAWQRTDEKVVCRCLDRVARATLFQGGVRGWAVGSKGGPSPVVNREQRHAQARRGALASRPARHGDLTLPGQMARRENWLARSTANKEQHIAFTGASL